MHCKIKLYSASWAAAASLAVIGNYVNDILGAAIGNAEAVPSVDADLLLKEQKMPPRSII